MVRAIFVGRYFVDFRGDCWEGAERDRPDYQAHKIVNKVLEGDCVAADPAFRSLLLV